MKNVLLRSVLLGAAVLAGSVLAQVQSPPESLLGSWEGALIMGRDESNLAFTITRLEGEYSAALVSSAMGIFGMPADSISFDGLNMKIKLPRLDGEFNGTLRLDASGDKVVRIDGDWFQYSEMVPIVLLPVDSPSY